MTIVNSAVAFGRCRMPLRATDPADVNVPAADIAATGTSGPPTQLTLALLH